jgi:hypothetical protein
MDTLEFFKAVWPAKGNYTLAMPFQTEDMSKEAWHHVPVKSIEQAVAVTKKYTDKNLFFAVHTTVVPFTEDPVKKNYRGDGPKKYFREHDNMLESRAFFFDLDVGESDPKRPPKYATRQEALDGLTRFLFATGLPRPLVTSSGGGFHVYWLLSDPLPSLEWRGWAAVLHHVARRVGLRADPARTTDQSSVLRVVGTQNIKPGRPSRPCLAVQPGATTETKAFLAELQRLLGDDKIADEVRYPKSFQHRRGVKGNLDVLWDGPTPTLGEVSAVCEHVRLYAETGHTIGNEPTSYYVGAGTVSYTDEGYEHMQRLAATHPRYDPDATHAKWEQWKERSKGPASCIRIDEKCGGGACAGCPFFNKGKNPLMIALDQRKTVAPPISADPSAEPVCLVEPGEPYYRKNGWIYKTVEIKATKDSPASTEEQVISTYDMFPIDECEHTDLEPAFTIWALKIPRQEKLQLVKVPNTILHDPKQLQVVLSNRRLYFTPPNFRKVMDMMLFYAKTLQAAKAANKQYDHLGWVNQDKVEFILPTEVIKTDGTSTPSRLSAAAQAEVGFIHTKGTLAEQVKLLEFYNEPQYLKHQFIIMACLGSVLFHASGQPGVVINASGKSGGSKSSALYAGASLWGRPKSYVMNGTNQGMTPLARLNLVHSLCQLPALMDEITMIEPKKAQEFVFNATQETQRIRLNPDGSQKATRGGIRSNMLITSANTSLHDLLQLESRAGTAGDMRVYEIFFDAVSASAAKANEFLHQIHECHYGHIGPEFLKRYMQDRVGFDDIVRKSVAELDAKWRLLAPERYWSAGAAVPLIAGELAFRWGLLPFHVEPVRAWAYGQQLKEMRGTVHTLELESGPRSLLGAFLNDKAGATVVVSGTMIEGNVFENPLREPNSALVAHEDRRLRIIVVRKDAFRAWCGDHNHNPTRTLLELERDGLVKDVDKRFVLGKGTKYAAAPAVCFTIDQTHPLAQGLTE